MRVLNQIGNSILSDYNLNYSNIDVSYTLSDNILNYEEIEIRLYVWGNSQTNLEYFSDTYKLFGTGESNNFTPDPNLDGYYRKVILSSDISWGGGISVFNIYLDPILNGSQEILNTDFSVLFNSDNTFIFRINKLTTTLNDFKGKTYLQVYGVNNI